MTETHETDPQDPTPPSVVHRSAWEANFPIVGMGASAGGLEAFAAFFEAMPTDSGMAFVLVVHLDPTHASMLPELLQQRTKMPVLQVQDGVVVEPNAVYIIPPNKTLRLFHGVLQLLDPPETRGTKLPINSFFTSLAEDQKSNAVAVILSGTGTDGTLGLRAIKGELGMVMVQDDETARYDGMPQSAISTNLVDYVSPPWTPRSRGDGRQDRRWPPA
jgi:two-component system, chemotaxis family, CheB/CheR fusion protein